MTKQKQRKEKNLALFRRIRNHILQVPLSYNQRSYGYPDADAPCGTACCIAGHALILDGRATAREVALNRRDDGEYISFNGEASEALGLTSGEAKILFTGDPHKYWPLPFAEDFGDAMSKAQQARVAADYINHIIKTGKVTG